jgi:hypothetical protein
MAIRAPTGWVSSQDAIARASVREASTPFIFQLPQMSERGGLKGRCLQLYPRAACHG